MCYTFYFIFFIFCITRFREAAKKTSYEKKLCTKTKTKTKTTLYENENEN